MKDKFIKFLMVLLLIAIVAMFIIFGKIIMSTYQSESTYSESEVEENKTLEISSGNDRTVENIQIPQIIEGSSVNNTEEQVQDYSNVQINRYFYNQLNEYEKYIYNSFEKSKEEMKTGTSTINLGNHFTDFLNSQNGDSEVLSKYYQSAVESYFYDNPDVFYLDPNKLYLTLNTRTYSDGKKEYGVYVNSGNEPNYLIDEFSSIDQVNNAISELEQVKNYLVGNKTGNTYNDIKRIHDYLIDNISYDESLSAPNIYNAYGALINKYCVCEGYSRALKYILDSMGIPCVIVVGTGTNPYGEQEKHAWNYVQCNGTWYAVDVTWDDPVAKGGAKVTTADKTRYFMKGSTEFNQTHSPSTHFTEGGKEFSYPQIIQ